MTFTDIERGYVQAVAEAMEGEWWLREYEEWQGWPIVQARGVGQLVFYITFHIDGRPSHAHIPQIPSRSSLTNLYHSKSLRFTPKMRPGTVAGRLNSLLPEYKAIYDAAEKVYLEEKAADKLMRDTLRGCLPDGMGRLSPSWRTITVDFATQTPDGDYMSLELRESSGRISRLAIDDMPQELIPQIVNLLLAAYKVKKED